MGDIFGKIWTDIKGLMDYQVSRQAVISSNLANQDTPGYKAKDISFDEHLRSRLALKRTNTNHRQTEEGSINYRTYTDPYERIGNDGNTVDLDREMMKISQNNILYSSAVETIQHHISILQNVIRSIK
ncbi:MAG: flagellar basal body rod protein FlgB [Syntrophaceae bacterium]